jgi:hypothetical protein
LALRCAPEHAHAQSVKLYRFSVLRFLEQFYVDIALLNSQQSILT